MSKMEDKIKAELLLKEARVKLLEAEKLAARHDVTIKGNLNYGIDNIFFMSKEDSWNSSEVCHESGDDAWESSVQDWEASEWESSDMSC